MFGIGMQELLIILVVALIVMGPTKLPGVARSIGKGMRELRRASDDLRSTIMFDEDEPQRGRYTQPPPAEPVASAPPAQTVAEKIAEEAPHIHGSLAASEAVPAAEQLEDNGTVARGSTSSAAAEPTKPQVATAETKPADEATS